MKEQTIAPDTKEINQIGTGNTFKLDSLIPEKNNIDLNKGGISNVTSNIPSVQTVQAVQQANPVQLVQPVKQTSPVIALNAAPNNINLNNNAINSPAGASLIFASNVETTKKDQENAENKIIGNLQYAKANNEKQKFVNLGDNGMALNLYGKKIEINYRKVFIISFSVIVISGLISILAYSYSQYLKIALQPVIVPPYDTLVKKYEQYEQTVSKWLPFSDYEIYRNSNLDGASGPSTLDSIIASDKLTYIQKKYILQQSLDGLFFGILGDYEGLDTIKQDVTKYGFLSKELYDLLLTRQNSTTIRKSLISLEVIKFDSAIKVFSYLDTFLEWFSTSLGISKEEVAAKMQLIYNRGENDVYTYLANCYLNPYEVDYNCNIIKDFDKYYDIIEKNSGFDIAFFKKLMQYIDIKLEQTEIPSFSIVFNKFDLDQKEISFSIDVNTFQKDELVLAQNNIINPHIFVVTQLLNLLKQSKFILGKSIDMRNLRVDPKVVTIGNMEYTLNNSRMSFTLPIQKSVEREIFDFDDNMNKRQLGGNILDSSKSFWTGDSKGHASAIQTGGILDTGSNLLSSQSLAELFIDIQKNQASLKYLIQEKGRNYVINQQTISIEELVAMGYPLEVIKSVIDYIASSLSLQSDIIDISKLRDLKEGKLYIDYIINERNNKSLVKSGAINSPSRTGSKKDTPAGTGFGSIRNFFETAK